MIKQWLTQTAKALISGNEINFTGPKTDAGILSNILSTVYFWAGVLAVGLIIYGGFMYVLSNGDPSKVKTAKDVLLYAVIGLVVVLLAFAITKIVIGAL